MTLSFNVHNKPYTDLNVMTTHMATDKDLEIARDNEPFFFRQICKIVARMHFGVVTFVLPDGRTLTYAGVEEKETAAIIHVHDFAFARRTILGGDIGFFESYADGQWSTPDLSTCLYVFAKNADHVQDAFQGNPLIEFLNGLRHAFNKNTHTGSKRNIMAHYDLGNNFYEKWLDPTMTYSSALFSPAEDDLTSAQVNKYENLAKSIDLKPGEHILEIGSGWGGFAEFAAKNVGANVTGLTLSPAQLEYARERIFKEDLNDKVEFRLQDYRDVNEQFDKVASIEMFEAVGKEYWPAYFDKVRNVLKPGGLAGLQIITIADRFFDNYLKSPDFIQRYVFPGGMLPSPSVLKDIVQKAGLSLNDVTEFGPDYAKTLAVWRRNFAAAWSDIQPLGFDDRFNKLWNFYLSYCEAGFRAGTTNVGQLTISRS